MYIYVRFLVQESVLSNAQSNRWAMVQLFFFTLTAFIIPFPHSLSGLNTEPDTSLLSHPALNEALNDPKNGNFAFKHLKQQVIKQTTTTWFKKKSQLYMNTCCVFNRPQSWGIWRLWISLGRRDVMWSLVLEKVNSLTGFTLPFRKPRTSTSCQWRGPVLALRYAFSSTTLKPSHRGHIPFFKSQSQKTHLLH